MTLLFSEKKLNNKLFEQLYPYSSNKKNQPSFGVFDHLVLYSAVVLILLMALLGYYKRLKEYRETGKVYTSRKLSLVPAILSQSISVISIISALGVPSEVFYRDFMEVWIIPAFAVGSYVSGYIFVPVFYHLQLETTHQYIGLRFGKRLQFFLAICFIFRQMMYIQIILTICNDILVDIGGTPAKITFNVMCTLYLIFITLGGLNAVVWSDVMNILILFASVFFLISTSNSFSPGSLAYFHNFLLKTGRTKVSTNDYNIYAYKSVSSVFLGSMFLNMATLCCSQSSVQRSLGCRTKRQAMMVILYANFGLAAIQILLLVFGLFMSIYYINCDPLSDGKRTFSGIMGTYFRDLMHLSEGAGGIVASLIIAVSITTFGSEMNSLSTVFVYDVFQRSHLLKETHKLRLGQLICMLFGIICIMFQLSPEFSVTNLDSARVIAEVSTGAFLGIYLLGILVPHGNEMGAFAGLIVSQVLYLTAWKMYSSNIEPGYVKVSTSCAGDNLYRSESKSDANLTLIYFYQPKVKKKLFDFSKFLFCPLSCMTSFCVGVLMTFVTGYTKPKDLDPDLIFPIFDKLFPFRYLPERIRKRLRSRVHFERHLSETDFRMNQENQTYEKFIKSQQLQKAEKPHKESEEHESTDDVCLGCVDHIGWSSPVDVPDSSMDSSDTRSSLYWFYTTPAFSIRRPRKHRAYSWFGSKFAKPDKKPDKKSDNKTDNK